MDAKTQVSDVLENLMHVIESRRGGNPEKSYVARLLHHGPNNFLKKIGEEATEVVIAAKELDREANQAHSEALIYEMADLWFHCLVAMAHYGIGPQQIADELVRRLGISGLDEKAARKAILRSQKVNP